MKSLIFLAMLCLPLYSISQSTSVANDIKLAISSNCLVCKKQRQDSLRTLQLTNNKFSNTDLCYHNCHVFFFENEFDSAYKYSLKAVSGSEIEKKSSMIPLLLYIKARVLFKKQLYKESLNEYLNLNNHYNLDEDLKANMYIYIGEIYLIENDYDSSLHYLQFSLQHLTNNDLSTLKNIYSNIASCYIFKNKIAEADDFFNKSISVFEQLHDTVGIASSYINMASQYYNQYEESLAVKYFKKGLEFALLTDDNNLKQIAYQNMAVVAENKGNYLSALKYRKEYEAQHDSIYNRDNVWSLAQQEKKLAVQDKEQKIKLAEQANKLQQLQLAKQNLEIKDQNYKIYTFLGLSITFLSFSAFVFYAYRQKSKQNKIITLQREELDALNHTKDQLFSVVAHDLRSPVQTLKITLSKLRTALREKNIGSAEEISGEIENISNKTYSLLNNLLHWALSQTGQLRFADDRLNLYRLTEQVFYDYESVAASKNINLENQVGKDLHCRGDMNTIKIILRNLLDNAIKFSEPYTSVIVLGGEENGACTLSVKDSGEGIDNEVVEALSNKNTRRLNNTQKGEQSTGIGLWLVKTMAERNGGSLHIQKQPKGTRIDIHLPQYQSHEQTSDSYC